MRLATVLVDGVPAAVVVRGDRWLRLDPAAGMPGSVREVAAGAPGTLDRIRGWTEAQPGTAWRPLAGATLAPVVPDPGAIYTIGHNYRASGEPPDAGPGRPLVYGKAASSVTGHGATLAWDRALTSDVDAECELGVVIGEAAHDVTADEAMRHVLGYTVINDVSARDPWLDGDQWLIGKSLPGFCPVGPWLITPDELDVSDLGLGCTVNGEAIQDGRTSGLRFGVAEVVAYLSRHVLLRPGDLIATGTPARLATPPGPGRRLAPGDVVTTWIERIGELTITIA